MTYAFLLLAALFLVPGTLVWFRRPDLRRTMAWMALASLPFAATERLFYPAYWTPRFVFDLADRIGFGIEDVLFLVGLAAFSSTAYAVVFRRTLAPRPRSRRDRGRDGPLERAAGRAVGLAVGAIGLAFGVTLLLLALGVPVVYAAVIAMIGVTLAMLGMRPDLVLPSVLGAAISAAIYFGLCLVFAALVPGVFDTTWRPSVLLPGWRVAGVPVDEILYGIGAGFAATVFPAWAFDWFYEAMPTTLRRASSSSS